MTSLKPLAGAGIAALLAFSPCFAAGGATEPLSAPAQKASAKASSTEALDRIAWFGRYEDALAEAGRTGRPILLMSAAPQCSGAPGMW